VKLVGAVEHDDMETWYNAADYFVLGSHREGSGFALCEAMACGCVPVVTRIPSFKKMTNDGKLGCSFEPGNAGQLFEALQRTTLLDTKPLRAEMRQFFEQHLSHEAIAREIHLACKDVLS
jgi:glycosyltransferase involved in cell wall biosynthesis